MISGLLLLAATASLQESVSATMTAPTLYIEGEPYPATVRIEAPPDRATKIPAWALSAAGFQLDGTALGLGGTEDVVSLVPGQVIETTLDLAEKIRRSEAFQGRDFRLSYVGVPGAGVVESYYLQRAERGIDFMQLPAAQLDDYDVVLMTMHGPIWLELWSDVAPEHVRNFLDLAYRGFYDDNHFHRVIPGFMVQGGGEKPDRPAPRRLKNEFNDRRHVAGVLSMARLGVDTKDASGNVIPQYDSATCEFFIVHKTSPHLDGKYTAFGRVVLGMDAVEATVDSVKDVFNPRNPSTHKPKVRQEILEALVVRAPARRPGDEK